MSDDTVARPVERRVRRQQRMETRMKTCGYFVVEACEDFEQVLSLKIDKGLPPGGVLTWTDRGRQACAMFDTRADAREAIQRTEHYRLAYGLADLPEKQFCSVRPVFHVTPNARGQRAAEGRSAAPTGSATTVGDGNDL